MPELLSPAPLSPISLGPAPPSPAPEAAHRPAARATEGITRAPVLAHAAWHALFWLFVANVIGVWLALLLLLPDLGAWTGAATYGRWMPVHLNLQLYGWLSLPLIAWLLQLYRAAEGRVAAWARLALTLWSTALVLGAWSWLAGHSSGKLFLDWSGYSRVFFPLSILFLWGVLCAAFVRSRAQDRKLVAALKTAGLCALLLVPFLLYIAASPALYPPVNPDSGGPTGASQLESVLVIVLILFALPYGLTTRRDQGGRWLLVSWIVFGVEAALCLALGRGDISHHRPVEWMSLGSLLVWVPLMPAYASAFHWHPATRPWRTAIFAWWAVLIPTGWCLFLPGVLDRLKFTDGLVSHSLLAMAGFVTNLLVLLLVILLRDRGRVFGSRPAFVAWQAATLLYVILMLVSGWIEGTNPTFTMVPGPLRNLIYSGRLLLGVVMAAASATWLLRLTGLLREQGRRRLPEREAA